MMSGAEEAGRLDDVLEHQAKYYAEESERKMTAMTKLFGASVWVLIGGRGGTPGFRFRLIRRSRRWLLTERNAPG